MGSVFRPITRLPLFKKVIKEVANIATGSGTAAPAVAAGAVKPASPTKPEDKPATGTETTMAIEDARRRSGRRRARRTGGMRLLMSQGNQGGDQKQTTLGPQ